MKSNHFINIIFLLLIIKFFTNSTSANYDNKYKNFANRFSTKVGIMVAAYNRPYYFNKVVKSLETNPESQTLPFFFFLDGGPLAKIKENKNIIKNSSIKNKIIIERPYNYGIAKNLIDARRFMFDWCQFKKVFVLEDDCAISPNYIKLVLSLHNWATKTFNNVGIVTGWSPCKLHLEEKLKKIAKVKETINHLWAYCLSKKTWDEMKEILYEYEKKFLNKKLNEAERIKKILQWRKQKITSTSRRQKTNKLFPEAINYSSLFNADKFATGQDGTTYFAHYMSGYVAISTEVNRALYIGKKGVHFNEAKWNNFGFDKVKLHNFAEDRYLSNFTI